MKCLQMRLDCGWQKVKCPSGCSFEWGGEWGWGGHYALHSVLSVAKIGFTCPIRALSGPYDDMETNISYEASLFLLQFMAVFFVTDVLSEGPPLKQPTMEQCRKLGAFFLVNMETFQFPLFLAQSDW